MTLPSGWRKRLLREVCEHVPNLDPSRSPECKFEYVDIGAVDNVTGQIAGAKKFLGGNAPSRARRPIQENDVLFSNVRTYLKNIARVTGDVSANLCSTGFTVLRPGNELDSSYLYHYVRSDSFVSAVTPEQTGTHYPATSDRVVLGQSIALPPTIEDQRNIANKLDRIAARLDDTRARLETIPSILKRFRMSVLAAACSGRLTEQWRAENPAQPSIESRLRSLKSARLAACQERDQESIRAAFESHEQPTGLPAGWLQLPARLCCHFITKGTTPKDVTPVGEVPFLKVHHIVDNLISFEPKPAFVPRATHTGILARSKVFPGDVVMNIVGPPLNKVAIIPATYAEWNINQALAIFRPIVGLKSEFLAYLLSLESTLQNVLEETRGSAGQSNISLEQCRNIPVLVPPEVEQVEILRRVDMLITQADTIEARYRKARNFTDKLMPSVLAKAFRGELV